MLKNRFSYSKKYIWIDKNGDYVKATFNNQNKYTFFSGIAK